MNNQNSQGMSMLDLILSMAHQAAQDAQCEDKKAQDNVEKGSIPHKVQPDYVGTPDTNPDFESDPDEQEFVAFMNHLYGSVPDDEPDDYWNYYDDDEDDLTSDFDDQQRPIHIYVENINIVIERD